VYRPGIGLPRRCHAVVPVETDNNATDSRDTRVVEQFGRSVSRDAAGVPLTWPAAESRMVGAGGQNLRRHSAAAAGDLLNELLARLPWLVDQR